MKRTPQRLAIKVKYLIILPSMRVICQKPFLTSQFQVHFFSQGLQFAPGISAVVTTLIPHVSVVVVPAVAFAYVLFTTNQKERRVSESAMKLSIFFINIC